MSGQSLQCVQCGKPMALADRSCIACGTPVPAGTRMGVLFDRVERQAEEGLYSEAVRSMDLVLAEFPEAKADKLLWRKRGGWLLRSGRPELMDGAESAFAEALRLDDSDDLSHQLWIDMLNRRGQLEKARAWYLQRLQLNPDDAMAKRQTAILKLTADFKAAPLPKLDIPKGRESVLYKMVKPNMYKAVTMGFSTLASAVQLYSALSSDSAELALQPELAGVGKLFSDPWIPGLGLLLGAAYLFWCWRELRG